MSDLFSLSAARQRERIFPVKNGELEKPVIFQHGIAVMPRRSPQLRSAPDESLPIALLDGLGALKLVTWEASGELASLRARLGATGCPAEFRASAGRELNWFRLIFPGDRSRVTAWLGDQLKSRSQIGSSLDYRLSLNSKEAIWVRHWARLAPVASLPSQTPKRKEKVPQWHGLIQVIEEQKRFETESLRAIEAERQVLGQELHDHTCQVLVGLSCLTQAFTNSAGGQTYAELKSLLAELNQQLAAAVERVRMRAHALVPAPTLNRGLPEALRALARQSQLLHGVKIALRLPATSLGYSKLHVMQLHGIVQESMVNAIRHGRATMIHITLRDSGRNHQLEIRDNGRGFAPEVPVGGIGLHLMRHRAALIGATMSISNYQPTGVRVRVNYSMA